MKNIVTELLLISIFKNITEDSVISKYIKFLSLLNDSDDFEDIVKSYTSFICSLYKSERNQNLYYYMKKLIYTDENILSAGCGKCIQENKNIISSAEYELSVLNSLLENDYSDIKKIFVSKFANISDFIEHLPSFNINGAEKFNLEDILNSYSKNGYGIFACYTAFNYTGDKEIKPVKYFNPLKFSDLKNYEYQKEVIKKNTKAFLDGKPANNILLYGDRGCGKSSTVKALINEFSQDNLKIIQVYKESFMYLPELFEKLANLPLKFIIFADDISFSQEDKNFSSIKAILEGSLSNCPSNTVIYATTNRMHLVRESFSARQGDEIHYNDTIDETVSLSDRFGIVLTFSLLTKTEYLDIVSKIALDCCIEVTEDLNKKAEEFAALKSIRTPRTARQFIIDYMASK
ncbi:MAG: ATP-binding protein [Candidatus Gastranaerophilales bacterium]|nr:ATP-binding protein [Candidatus Gastranaerophilales bacterium]